MMDFTRFSNPLASVRRLPVLYHGTLAANVPYIQHGVTPKIGESVKLAYGEEIPRRFVFATEDPKETRGYIVFQIERRYGLRRVTRAQLSKLGAVAVFRSPSYADWKHCEPEAEECEDISAEPGDWYTPYEVKPTEIVTGNALLSLLGVK